MAKRSRAARSFSSSRSSLTVIRRWGRRTRSGGPTASGKPCSAGPAGKDNVGPILLISLLLVFGLTGPAAAGPLDGPGAPQALVCSACHGFAGQSQSNTMPILAGMAPWYFKKSIQDYAAGKRTSPEMEPYAKMVLQFGVDDVAAYFGAQKRTASPAKLDPAAVEPGRAAAVQCTLCHGVSGKGDPAQGVPDLTGQPPGNLSNQMRR